MLKIGCHLSSAKGYSAMGRDAVSIGANVFQFFTRNPRGGKAKEINEGDVSAFLSFAKENGICAVLAHASYTLNPSAADEEKRNFAKETMADDLKRMEHTPENFYNFHPGSHVGQGTEAGIEYISSMLNEVLSEGQSTTVLLETMAGKGSEIGGRFEELAEIIKKTRLKNRLGICLDTCHVWDGGYDIVNDLDGVLSEFDRTIGIERLYAVHLNGSLNECGAKKDRHAKIGEGKIGLEAMAKIINHPALRELPFYLETPNELSGYAKEIKLLKDLYKY